jgi:hypothetical protein
MRGYCLLVQCVVSILRVLAIFCCGYVKRKVAYKGYDLRLHIFTCYSWEMALKTGLDGPFDVM